MRTYLFEHSDAIASQHLLEWAFIGSALGLFFVPSATPTYFDNPRRLQIFAGALVGIGVAVMSYGGLLSGAIGAAVGAGIGFLAPYWSGYRR